MHPLIAVILTILALPDASRRLPLPPAPYHWIELEANRPLFHGGVRSDAAWLPRTTIHAQEGGLDDSDDTGYGLRYAYRGGEYDFLMGLRSNTASGTGLPGRALSWNGTTFPASTPLDLDLERVEGEALVSLNGSEQEGEYIGVLLGARHTRLTIEASTPGVSSTNRMASTYPVVGLAAQFPIAWRVSGRGEFIWSDLDGFPSGTHAKIRCQRYLLDLAFSDKASVELGWRLEDVAIEGRGEAADLRMNGPAVLFVARF